LAGGCPNDSDLCKALVTEPTHRGGGILAQQPAVSQQPYFRPGSPPPYRPQFDQEGLEGVDTGGVEGEAEGRGGGECPGAVGSGRRCASSSSSRCASPSCAPPGAPAAADPTDRGYDASMQSYGAPPLRPPRGESKTSPSLGPETAGPRPLLPAERGGPPVAVDGLPPGRLHRRVHVPLRRLLLRRQDQVQAPPPVPSSMGGGRNVFLLNF